MSDPRLSRIDDTLQSLFESLVPPQHPGEDDSEADLRIDRAIELAKQIAHHGDNNLPEDVNQAQDLIRRKLLRENSSPEKAARFSNLYSRLLSIPVLNQKWSILYLLYSLSPPSITERSFRSPLTETDHQANVIKKPSLPQQKTAPQSPPDAVRNLTSRYGARVQASPAKFSPDAKRKDVEQLDQRTAQIPTSHPNDVQPQLQHYDAPQPSPSENDLLQDLPFNLQGLSSAHLKFTTSNSITLSPKLSIPVLSLVHALAEPCLLYRSLTDYVGATDTGLFRQSLKAAISHELRSYLGLVATLEGEIRRAAVALEHDGDRQSTKLVGVTLKKCVIWTSDATLALRLLSLIVEESKKRKGGQILSLIHGLCSAHGDPFVSTFANRLLEHVALPFYEMLRHWVYGGELIDPYHEFFVTEPDPNSRPDIDPRRVATSVWEDKYKLDNDMIPSMISNGFAKKVFLIGKSLNFIRHNCGDSDWVIQYSTSHSKPLGRADTANLSSTIDTAYEATMSRLTDLMSSKFGLFTHLSAIKKYLLLSQGDFVELLMESLAPNLDRPANSQYRHTLTSQLEHAIRHSNAQFDDPEVLRRLDARMLELSSGEIGWDCFTLEYKISPPCDVVITQWASTQYLKIFNLLWRIKRVQFSLNTTWRRCMTGSRGVLAAVEDELGHDWKRGRCVVAEMVHFVNQLQYYILFEVVESSWETLQKSLKRPGATLDDLIEAHTKYITSITHKGLLGQQRHAGTGQREDSFLAQLHYILKCMLNYRDVVDGLYSYSVAEFTRRQQFTAKVEQRTKQGKWGITEKDMLLNRSNDSRTSTPLTRQPSVNGGRISTSQDLDSYFTPLLPTAGDLNTDGITPGSNSSLTNDPTLLSSLRTRLLSLSAEFRSRLNVLLYDLAHQPDVDMRFLGVVMNFNEVYKPVNVRRMQARKDRENQKETEKRTRAGDGGSMVSSTATAAGPAGAGAGAVVTNET